MKINFLRKHQTFFFESNLSKFLWKNSHSKILCSFKKNVSITCHYQKISFREQLSKFKVFCMNLFQWLFKKNENYRKRLTIFFSFFRSLIYKQKLVTRRFNQTFCFHFPNIIFFVFLSLLLLSMLLSFLLQARCKGGKIHAKSLKTPMLVFLTYILTIFQR